jgi:glycosyltransferase involved in cell wall biosynthesis
MKVIQLVNGRDTGGAMTHILALLKGFSSSVQVVLVTLNEGPVTLTGREMGLEVHCLDGSLFSQYFQLSKIIRNSKDLALVHTHGSRANLLAGLFSFRRTVPIVTSIHSDYMLDYDETLLRRLVFKPMSQWALKLTSYQIAISEGIKTLLISRGFKAENMYSVYNGLDFSKYEPTMSQEQFMADYKVPYFEGVCYVGIVTRFHPVKGLDVFIKAAAQICEVDPSIIFLIAGSGEAKAKGYYQQLVDATGQSARIIMLGFIRPISNMIQLLDVNVLTSHSETFPYALLEGGYFGVPAISSRVGGVAELITHNETGLLFEDSNVDQLVEQINRLSKDAELRERLGKALQIRVKSEHTHVKMADAYQGIYTHIIGRWKK